MGHYTLILMPDDASAVRQLRIRLDWLRKGAVGALGAMLLCAAIAVDWARLRRDAVDARELRARTAAQEEQIRVQAEEMRLHAEQVRAVEAQLAELREFERKVRIIANLPGRPADRSPETTGPAQGVGGGADDPARATPPIGAPTGANAGGSDPVSSGANAAGSDPVSSVVPSAPDGWVLARARTDRLAEQARQQHGSLRRLLEQIQGKAERLASTPSIWPVKGWLTSRFGYRISPFTGLRDFHAGIDIAAEPGSAIHAPARGRVVFAGAKGALGHVAVLDHGFGVRTTYGHAQEVLVKPGQRVERGQVIAAVGSSGRSTGPHLHYAVERDGRAANPLDYIVE